MTLRRQTLPVRLGSVLLAVFSMILLSFGVSFAGIMLWPIVVDSMTESSSYYPPLPVSEDRDETLFGGNELPLRSVYPSLTNIEASSDAKSWIRIPSIGVNVPLVLSPTMKDESVLETLEKGAALYPNGILPGRMGNLFVAAHSTGEPWKGAYRFAFLKINELTSNNLIHIDYENARYTYRIVNKNVINPSEDFTIKSQGFVPTITIMACWPLWSTEKRILVRGELTNITKLSPSPG